MRHRALRSLATALLATTAIGIFAGTASAHEERTVGAFDFAVGFGNEPAYAGEPNSVQLFLSKGGRPVVDLGDTLNVDVVFGDAEPLSLSVEPFFEEGEFGTLGDYRAWFIPTSAGQYTFHFTGKIDGQSVDETFTSGPKTFDDVVSPSDVEYPVQPPSAAELADRIARDAPRLSTAADQARSATVQAQAASDDAQGAQTLAVVGILVGALGLVAGVAALVLARRKPAGEARG